MRNRSRYNVLWSYVIFSLLAIFLLTGCGHLSAKDEGSSQGLSSESVLDVYVLDIGQGDAIVIKSGNHYSMIDTGKADDESRFLLQDKLKALGVRELDNLIITHPHADHLGGAWRVMKDMPVKHIYDNGVDYKSSTYKTYVKTAHTENIPRTALKEGDVVDFGDGALFTVYAPSEEMVRDTEKWNTNNQSIVGKLTKGDFSMLFTGDAEKEEEQYLVKKYNTKLASQVLKVGHHGSRTSSTDDFVRSVRPQFAIISVGEGNEYKHPHDVAIKRLVAGMEAFHKNIDAKERIYRTDRDHTIHVMTDGKQIEIQKMEVGK